MTTRLEAFAQSAPAAWLGIAVCASAAILGAIAYRAAREWQQSATIVANQHAQQGADLLALALRRDMRGVQVSVLSSQDWNDAMAAGTAEASRSLASTFARFPYPELFFWWNQSQATETSPFFTRSDRIPSWLQITRSEDGFPVVLGTAPEVVRRISTRVSSDVAQRRAYSIFDLRIGTHTYQVISRLRYQDPLGQHLQLISGFMVNLDWARGNYFTDITRQVAGLAGTDAALVFTTTRSDEAAPLDNRRPSATSLVAHRILPMAFFDPTLIAADPPKDLMLERWTISSTAIDDQAVRAASTGSLRVLIAAPIAVFVFSLGMALTFRAARTHARLAQLRADFVSTVTHELKTPVATIRAAGDTLAEGRITSSTGSREYAEIVVEEAKTLTRLLDNLLAYSRVTDTRSAYSFRPIPLGSIVGDVLRNSQSRLAREGFTVDVTIPDALPLIQADRTSLFLALENLVDNAIRYSRERRGLTISASVAGGLVRVDVADLGIGIPEDEVGLVTSKFYRGSRSGTSGSGLGLALAQRIIADHGGLLTIQSAIDIGTTVTITVPVAKEEAHDEARPRYRRQRAPLESAVRQPEI